MADPALAGAQLRRLVALGVQVALDDFGTGYSSLSLLRDLPVRQVKIDRSFVTDLPNNSRDRRVVEAITRLAHGLGACACAEGVETAAQFYALSATGCDDAQGFLLGTPRALNPLCTQLIAAGGRSPPHPRRPRCLSERRCN